MEHNYKLLSYAYKLNPSNPSVCADLDDKIAENTNTFKDLVDVSYYICYCDAYKHLPLTRKKINDIVLNHVSSNVDVAWDRVRVFYSWLYDDGKSKLFDMWASGNIETNNIWMADFTHVYTGPRLSLLETLVSSYKKCKVSALSNAISKCFMLVEQKDVDLACKIMSNAPNVIQIYMLNRHDIQDKYTLLGLKALSKLSKQRDLNIKIDFEMLGNLNPKSRLDAMKHMMGMFDKHYKYLNSTGHSKWRVNMAKRVLDERKNKWELPFKKVPSRDDVARFLFPCSIQYNDEVNALLNMFDEICTKQEKRRKANG